MSGYPSDQRCPRCQYPVAPGAQSCANCGLAFTGTPGAAPGANPAYPPAQPGSGVSYGTLPASGYSSSQPPTTYVPPGSMNSAPTVASPLYPPGAGAPGSGSYPSAYPGSQPSGNYASTAPAYPGSQPPGGYPGSAPAYPGSQPPGGYSSSAPSYPGSQPPGSYPGSAPSYPGSQSSGTYPGSPPAYPGPAPTYPSPTPPYPGILPADGSQPIGGFGAPPIVAPPQTPAKKSGPSALLIAIIVIVVLVLVGGGGTAAYLLTRPKPVIEVTSAFKSGSNYAGSSTTVFHVTGSKFSGSSTITFLLDEKDAPGSSTVMSNSDGNIKADLTVTTDWNTGNHVLKAKDADGYETQAGVTLAICDQGECGTPGPNGAPTDSLSFTLNVAGQAVDAENNQPLGQFTDTLSITGKADPNGGTVCQGRDDGSPQTLHGTVSTSSGTLDYTETVSFTCMGMYKAGQLSYTEMATSAVYDFSVGFTCTATNAPFIEQQLTGTFASATGISGGKFMASQVTLFCDQGVGTAQFVGKTGTWTGTVG